MCVTSMIYDYARDHWPPNYPTFVPTQTFPVTFPPPALVPPPQQGPTKEQFEELLKLLRAAQIFDKQTGQPDCEDDSKKQLIRDMAQRLGVDVKDL